jgi:hypothetical protein
MANRLRSLGRTGKRAALAGALIAGALRAERAGASEFEVLGVGPTGIAEANARAARATDGSAAFFNPAGLGMGQGIHVDVAPELGGSALSVQGRGAELADPFGLVVLADATVPFKSFLEDRIRVGIALYVPPQALHLILEPADKPQLPYFANRTQRLVVEPAIGVRLASWLAIGGGIDVLGGVQGPADVRPGASGAPEPRIGVDATTQVAAHAGVRVDLSERVHLGAAYRQEFGVPISVQTKAEIGGISLDAGASIRQALFDPHTFVLAAAFDLDRLELELDASYSVWSAYKGPALDVRASLPGALLTSEETKGLFRDVGAVRGAASYGVDVGRSSEVVLSAGAGFEPSVLSGAPQGTTNFADGSKVFGGLGAGLSLREWLPKTVRIAAGLGVIGLIGDAIDKKACTSLPCPAGTVVGPDPTNPAANIQNPGYPTLRSGGALLTGSLGIGVDL